MIYVRNGKVNASLFQRPACSCALDTTPVGFEPTRGDRIGLAGRRLNHSAKVSHDSGARWNAISSWRLGCGRSSLATLVVWIQPKEWSFCFVWPERYSMVVLQDSTRHPWASNLRVRTTSVFQARTLSPQPPPHPTTTTTNKKNPHDNCDCCVA